MVKRDKILLCDYDVVTNSNTRRALSADYEIFSAISQRSLINILEIVTPDLIMLKIETGTPHEFKVLEMLKKSPRWYNIPVMVNMDQYNEISVARALKLGADACALDYPTLIRCRIATLLSEIHYREEAQRCIALLEEQSRRTRAQVFELQNAVFSGMASALESRDDLTGRHIERTQFYLGFLVEQLEVDDVYTAEMAQWDVDTLVASAVLHDIGKIAIPDAILFKPGRLSAEEFEVMKSHVDIGVRMIEAMKNNTSECPFLDYAKTIAAAHHERWDGSGYPNGLSGEQIPLAGRLMAIADVYDAIISKRVYKERMPPHFAQQVIEDGSGTHFDPVLVEAFKKTAERFASTALRFEDIRHGVAPLPITSPLHDKDGFVKTALSLLPTPISATEPVALLA
jgi:putative two-component system response regulator